MALKVLIAPQEFKGTLTASQAAQAMLRGFTSVYENALVDVVPIADGGAGTVDVLLAAGGGEERSGTVTDPIGRPVSARWGVLDGGKTAVIVMADELGDTMLATRRLEELARAAGDAFARIVRMRR